MPFIKTTHTEKGERYIHLTPLTLESIIDKINNDSYTKEDIISIKGESVINNSLTIDATYIGNYKYLEVNIPPFKTRKQNQ